MDEALRQRRIAQLRLLLASNPRHLIERYCRIAGELTGNQLPHVSFSHMIDAIVDHEAQGEKSSPATN